MRSTAHRPRCSRRCSRRCRRSRSRWAIRRSARRAVPRARDPEPIEQEGTYPLPEAQLDRFMLKSQVGYPSRDDEVKIIDRMAGAGAEPSASKGHNHRRDRRRARGGGQVFVDDKVKRYAVDLVGATRDPKASNLPSLAPLIDNGASVRASIALIKVAKAQALLSGRSYISPHDVKTSRTTCCATASWSRTRPRRRADDRSRDRGRSSRTSRSRRRDQRCFPPRSRKPSSASVRHRAARCPT